jgi:hypothetical protein
MASEIVQRLQSTKCAADALGQACNHVGAKKYQECYKPTVKRTVSAINDLCFVIDECGSTEYLLVVLVITILR